MKIVVRCNAGLITTLLLIAVGVGLLAYFKVDLRAIVGAAIRLASVVVDAVRSVL
jgi:hypothetical protein